MKRLTRVFVLFCTLAIIISAFATTPVFATETNDTSDQGIGVSPQPPSSVNLMGTSPPSSSNETITLGEYRGSVTWASGLLYTDKWVRTTGSTIKINTNFGVYSTKEDAINKKNRLVMLNVDIPIRLIDSNKNKTSWKYVRCNQYDTATFSVTPNTDYYVEFNFNSGYYHSGDFRIYK